MKISELIAAVGKDSMSFQVLDQCILELGRGPKNSTVIRFETSETGDETRMDRMGVIVWLDRVAVSSVLAESMATALPDAMVA